MRKRKIISTIIVLVAILTGYETEAAGFNGHKGSDNPKDLQIIHDKFTIGRENTIEIVKKLTTTMKQEQKGFETELDAFLKSKPDAPASMKKMLSEQKAMQAEVDKLATDVQKYKGHFEKWLGDVNKLKTKDNMTIYEGCKPFIRELDPMTDRFKAYTQKFIDQAKKYKDFGQTMLDSKIVDTKVNKRLCSLGKVIQETGFHVSDVGDPIAIAADKIGDIWQRTNPKDKDNSLVQISMNLVPKAQQLVSDGDNQATDGKKLVDMCKKIEKENQANAETTPKPKDDDKYWEEHGKPLVEMVYNFCGLMIANLEKLRVKLVEFQKELENIEGNLKADLKNAGVGKEAENMKVEVEKLKVDFKELGDEVHKLKSIDQRLGGYGTQNAQYHTRLFEVLKKMEVEAGKILANGEGLIGKKKFTKDTKAKFDVVGGLVLDLGNIFMATDMINTTFWMNRAWNGLAVVLTEPANAKAAKASDSIFQDGRQWKEYGPKVNALGEKIKKLEANKEVEPAPKSEGPAVPELEEIAKILIDLATEMEKLKVKCGELSTADKDVELKVKQPGKSKEYGELKDDVEKLQADFKELAEVLRQVRNPDHDKIADLAQNNREIFNKLVKVVDKINNYAFGPGLVKAEDLQKNKQYTTDIKAVFDVLGKRLEEVGDIANGMKPNMGKVSEKWNAYVRQENVEKAKVLAKNINLASQEIMGHGLGAKDLGLKIQKLEANGAEKPAEPPATTTPKPVDLKDLEDIEAVLGEIGKDLEAIMKDLETIKAEQAPIETSAGNEYAEPDVIPKEVDELIKECKRLIGETKDASKQIEGVRKGPPKDIGVGMHPISKSILKLNKDIIVLAEKNEQLGQKILKNGEGLKDKEKFTPEIKAKTDIQGKRLESIGGKLKNIGKNFGVISDKMASLGDKLEGFDGTKMKEYSVQLKELADKLKEKGGPVEEVGVKIQKLQPIVKDMGTDKDLEDMIKALGEIGNDLEAIMKDLKAIQDEQKGIEADAGKDYPEPNAIGKEAEALIADCKKGIEDTKAIAKDIEKARAGPQKDVGKALQPIGQALLDFDKRILELAEKIEKLAQKVLKNGEDLKNKEKFPPELKAKFDKVGKKFESICGRLKNIAKNFGIIGDRLGSIGKRLKEDGPKLIDLGKQIKEFGEKVNGKGGSVAELGVKIQKMEPTVKDMGTDKDLEDMIKALGEIGNDLEAIMKDLKAIQDEQKGIEADAGKDYPEPNAIGKEAEVLIADCKKGIEDTKAIAKDIEKARAGPQKDVGKALQPIGQALLDFDKRILELAEKIEKLAQKVLKNGEDLKNKEKFPPELKAKFDKVGKKFESIGGKLKNIAKNFGIIGDRLGSIGKRLKDDGPKLVDFGKQIKEFGEKVNGKGGSVAELGVKIQKLEPTVKDMGTDKDLEDMIKALGEIGNDLEAIMKDLKAIQEEQKGIETDAGNDHPEPKVVPKEAEELANECKKLIDDCKEIAKDIEKARAGPQKDVGKALQPIGKKLYSLDERILALAKKLEALAQKVLKHGEDLKGKEKFPPELKAKFDKVGKKFENIGGKLKNIAKNFGVIGSKMESIGKRVGGDDGATLTNYGNDIKDLASKIDEKGGAVEQLGIKIQKLEPTVKDMGTDKDLEDMIKALGEIGNDLDAIMKVRHNFY